MKECAKRQSLINSVHLAVLFGRRIVEEFAVWWPVCRSYFFIYIYFLNFQLIAIKNIDVSFLKLCSNCPYRREIKKNRLAFKSEPRSFALKNIKSVCSGSDFKHKPLYLISRRFINDKSVKYATVHSREVSH